MERLTVAQLAQMVPGETIVLIDSGVKGKPPVVVNQVACIYKPMSGTVTLFGDEKLSDGNLQDR